MLSSLGMNARKGLQRSLTVNHRIGPGRYWLRHCDLRCRDSGARSSSNQFKRAQDLLYQLGQDVFLCVVDLLHKTLERDDASVQVRGFIFKGISLFKSEYRELDSIGTAGNTAVTLLSRKPSAETRSLRNSSPTVRCFRTQQSSQDWDVNGAASHSVISAIISYNWPS